jgi:SAM-dependent methyltransferase
MSPESQHRPKEDSDWNWDTDYKRSKLYLEHLSRCKVKSEAIADIGMGYGGPALAFSESSLTVGLDVSKESLQLALKRAKNQKRNKLHLILASGTQLPIKEAYADLAVLMGTFEFFPRVNPLENPETTHLNSLKDANRILKKQGSLLLGIENRYWLLYWFGMRDFHSGLPFVTVFPRRWADFACKMLRRKRYYLERLYSIRELMVLLERAGFNVVHVNTVLPNWMKCQNIADIDNKKEVAEKLEAINPWKPPTWAWFLAFNYSLCVLPKCFWKLLNAVGLLKFFCSNFIIVARKK